MMIRQRQECLDCESHTYRDACGNCGSKSLRPVLETVGDTLRGDAPAPRSAHEWKRDLLDAEERLSFAR
jgi:hypothetical protein